MKDKNEGIFLWLLEQDRKRSRALALEQTARDSAVQLSHGPADFFFESEEPTKDGHKALMPSEPADLERLLKEKAYLEEESRCLDEKQKQLNLRAKVLWEKIVQEARRKNRKKQQAVNQLKKRIGELETQLQGISSSNSQGESGAAAIENLNKLAVEASDEQFSNLDQDGITLEFTETD